MSDIAARLARLERGILAAIKDTAQSIPELLSIEILDQMDVVSSVKRPDGSRRLPKNNTNRLRNLYNNLSEALQPGGIGNVSKWEFKQGKYSLEFGFNPMTKVTQGPRQGDLRYGLLHEYGGTIPHPGGTPYIVVEGGKAVFVSIAKAQEIEAKTGRKLPVTKPHSITMKARPFLRPGLAQFEKDAGGLPAVIRELETAIVDEFLQEFG